MKLVTGNTIWNNINKIPQKYTYLSDNIDCDVAVIGGGITGAICAYYLTKSNISTVVLDKNLIGYGSTSASTSILQYEIDTDLGALKDMIGMEPAVRAFKLGEKAVSDIQLILKDLDDDCGFNLQECFYYTFNINDVPSMRKEFDLRQSNGFDVEFFDELISRQRFSFPVKAGIYSKKGAAGVDPYRFTHSIFNFCSSKGTKIFENTNITEIIPSDNGVTLVSSNKYTVKAKKVIIATGYEANPMIKERIVHLTRSFTIVTKPVKEFPGWFNKCIIRDNSDTYTYLRTTPDNRIIIGGEDLDVGGDRSKVRNLPDNNHPISIAKYNILLNRLKSMFPQLKDVEIEYSFSGIFGNTRDGLPYIGEYTPMPNCYFCLGYGANGILYAVTGAQLIRDLYLGVENPARDIYSFNR